MLGVLTEITNFYYVSLIQVLDALLCEYEKSVQGPGKWQKLSVFLQQRFVYGYDISFIVFPNLVSNVYLLLIIVLKAQY